MAYWLFFEGKITFHFHKNDVTWPLYSVVALGNVGCFLRLWIGYLYWRDTSAKGSKGVHKMKVYFISLVKEKQKQQHKSENYERWRLFKLR